MRTEAERHYQNYVDLGGMESMQKMFFDTTPTDAERIMWLGISTGICVLSSKEPPLMLVEMQREEETRYRDLTDAEKKEVHEWLNNLKARTDELPGSSE